MSDDQPNTELPEKETVHFLPKMGVIWGTVTVTDVY